MIQWHPPPPQGMVEAGQTDSSPVQTNEQWFMVKVTPEFSSISLPIS